MKTTKYLFPFLLVIFSLNVCFSSLPIKGNKLKGLSGTVYSEEEKFLDRVEVIALDCSYIPIKSIQTDEKGEFLIVDNIDQICSLRIQREGFLSYDIKELTSYLKGDHLHIFLKKSSSISGSVVNGNCFSPLKGVSIKLLQKQENSRSNCILISHQLTDKNGKYFFNNIPSGKYLLEVKKKRFINTSIELPLQKGERKIKDIFLFTKSVLNGSIKDLDGNPIGGARIEILNDLSTFFKEKGKIFEDRTYSTESSAVGLFTLNEIPEYRNYQLSVVAENFSPKIITKDMLSRENTIHITLLPSSSISGTIKNEDGTPIRHADVRIRPHNLTYSKGLKELFQKSYHPSALGIFIIRDLPSGSYTLTIHSHDTIPYMVDIFNLKSGDDKNLGDINLIPGLKITGTVENEDGGKIESAKVTAILSGVGGKIFLKKTKSKKDGAFSIPGLREGIYSLRSEAKGYAEEFRKGIRAGRSNILLTLKAAGNIKGYVLDERGNAIDRFYIHVKPDTINTYRKNGKYYSFSSETGYYEISNLKPGSYSLSAGALGFSEEARRGVEVCKEIENEEINFILKEGGKIEGYIYEEEYGFPVAGAAISILGQWSKEMDVTAISDLNGYFLLECIPSQIASIVASHPDYAPIILENIDSSRSMSYNPLKIYLEPGGTIEGYVLEANDSPICGATLSICNKGFDIKAISDLNGYYHMDHIPVGGHTLIKTLARLDIYSDYESKKVDIKNNEILRIDFKYLTEALGFLKKKGIPIEGAKVTFIESPHSAAYDSSDLLSRSSFTDSTGFYRIRGLKEGRYSVVVESAEKRFIRNVEIPKVKDFHYDIAFPEYEISGRVFDAESLVSLPASEIRAILSEIKGFVIFSSQQYEEDGSPSSITGATAEMQFALTDAEGFFTLSVDKEGEYSVSASIQGYTSKTISTHVSEGKTTMLEFPLMKSSTLKGKVKGPSEEALIGGMAYLRWNDTTNAIGFGSDGRFILSELEPATYSLFILVSKFAPLVIDQYKIEAGKDYKEEFVLSRGAPLKIIVSPNHLRLNIQIIDRSGREFVNIFKSFLSDWVSVTKEEGKKIYSFPNLPAGPYKIVLASSNGSAERAIEILEGAVTTVEFEF